MNQKLEQLKKNAGISITIRDCDLSTSQFHNKYFRQILIIQRRLWKFYIKLRRLKKLHSQFIIHKYVSRIVRIQHYKSLMRNAIKIQSFYRMIICKRELHKKSTENKNAIKIQSNVRGMLQRIKCIEIKKNFTHIRHVIKEWISTEITYLKKLDTICTISDNLKENQIISKNKVDQLFSYVQTLQQLHKQYNTDLQNIEERRYLLNFILILDSYLHGFKLYTEYYKSFNKNDNLMSQLIKEVPQFKQFVNNLKNNQNIDLINLFIEPIQRLPKYALLLTDLIKKMDKTHPYYLKYTDSLNKLQNILDQNNIILNIQLKQDILADLQRKCGNQVTILEPGRSLDKEPEEVIILLDQEEQKVTMFTMNDMVLIMNQNHYVIHITMNQFSNVYQYQDLTHQFITKICGIQAVIMVVNQNQQEQNKMIEIFQQKLNYLRSRQSVKNRQCISIQVQVISHREQTKILKNYLEYAIKILINDFQSIILVRLQKLKSIQEKYCNKYNIAKLSQSINANNIENFLQTLLSCQDFQNETESIRSTILTTLQLNPSFYELSTELTRNSLIKSVCFKQNDKTDCIQVQVFDQKLKFQINNNSTSRQILQQIQKLFQFFDCRELRLFQIGDNKSEKLILLEQVVNKNHKYVLRKYLNLNLQIPQEDKMWELLFYQHCKFIKKDRYLIINMIPLIILYFIKVGKPITQTELAHLLPAKKIAELNKQQLETQFQQYQSDPSQLVQNRNSFQDITQLFHFALQEQCPWYGYQLFLAQANESSQQQIETLKQNTDSLSDNFYIGLGFEDQKQKLVILDNTYKVTLQTQIFKLYHFNDILQIQLPQNDLIINFNCKEVFDVILLYEEYQSEQLNYKTIMKQSTESTMNQI